MLKLEKLFKTGLVGCRMNMLKVVCSDRDFCSNLTAIMLRSQCVEEAKDKDDTFKTRFKISLCRA